MEKSKAQFSCLYIGIWSYLRYIKLSWFKHLHERDRYGIGPVGSIHPSEVAEGSQAGYLTTSKMTPDISA